MCINSARQTHRRTSGFTLLEVLVALSILSISFGVLMQSFGDFSRTAGVTEDYRQALMVAESQLAWARADPASASAGYGDTADERFRWTLSSSRFAHAVPAARQQANSPELVTIEVSWDDGGRQRSISLSTVVLGFSNGQGR